MRGIVSGRRRLPLVSSVRFFLALLLPVLLLPVCRGAVQRGVVQSGKFPLPFSRVTLYRAGPGAQAPATELGTTEAGINGHFRVLFSQPADRNAVLYLVAQAPRNGNEDGSALSSGSVTPSGKSENPETSPVVLTTVTGNKPVQPGVVINERTTVATVYAFAQFLHGKELSGTSPGLQNAVATFNNLVNVRTGGTGAVLGDAINGASTTTLAETGSLANILAGCVRHTRACATLFHFTTAPGGAVPDNTLVAAGNIARYPWHHVPALFHLSLHTQVYRPALPASKAPDAWTLAVRYSVFSNDNHHIPLLDGPGNIVFDAGGDALVNNNYANSVTSAHICGDDRVYGFAPGGNALPGSPFGGKKGNGGLYGSGFGIVTDKAGNIWAGSFGFQGSGCRIPGVSQRLLAGSLSQFDAHGRSVSPDRPPAIFGGWRSLAARFARPQGMALDPQGNLWTVNCANDSVTKLTRSRLPLADNFSHIGLDNPFAVAIDGAGNAWVTSNNNSTVLELTPQGLPARRPVSGGEINKPMGIAADSYDNIWVANAGVQSPPCSGSPDDPDPRAKYAHLDVPPEGASVAMISHDGTVRAFSGGGIFWPWGVAVDGNDNVWVANFGGPQSGLIGVTELCGAGGHCPAGFKPGDGISPATGFTSNAFTRLTGIAIDPSGNVWVANNWLRDAFENLDNPGGHAVVVLIGAAAPVRTPVIGPPRRP